MVLERKRRLRHFRWIPHCADRRQIVDAARELSICNSDRPISGTTRVVVGNNMKISIGNGIPERLIKSDYPARYFRWLIGKIDEYVASVVIILQIHLMVPRSRQFQRPPTTRPHCSRTGLPRPSSISYDLAAPASPDYASTSADLRSSAWFGSCDAVRTGRVAEAKIVPVIDEVCRRQGALKGASALHLTMPGRCNRGRGTHMASVVRQRVLAIAPTQYGESPTACMDAGNII